MSLYVEVTLTLMRIVIVNHFHISYFAAKRWCRKAANVISIGRKVWAAVRQCQFLF